MKHLNKLFAGVLLLAGLATNAQNSTNPWAISFGASGLDTKISMKGNDHLRFEELYNITDNFNVVPSISYVNVSRNIGGSFSLGLQGSFNKVSKWVEHVPGTENTHVVVNPGDLNTYAIDGIVTYSFQDLLKSKWLAPTLHVGGGYNFFGDASAGTVGGGFGLDLWFAKNVALTLNSTLKYSFDDERAPDVDVPTHMLHTAGLKFQFGAKDTDNDGIIDKEDACPTEFGLAAFNGCPDRDGDGIQDSADTCPDDAGLEALQGCPDTDGDGIADKDDDCVDIPGLPVLKGCPDTDGDGVADKNDTCPTVKGDKANKGCPWPDTDGDGVLDKDDKCPSVKGTVKNAGCPEVDDTVVKRLNDYAKTILFDTNKFSFQQQTYPVLQAMLGILKEYPSAKFMLEGHTDADGKDAANLELSKNRAAAVKNWLVENGIAADRLTSEGYGETRPVAPNKTKADKAKNRRVEVKLLSN